LAQVIRQIPDGCYAPCIDEKDGELVTHGQDSA
jgi:hypothetical protein